MGANNLPPKALPEFKKCKDCKETLPITEFRIGLSKDPNRAPCPQSYCKKCHNKRTTICRLLRVYGLTPKTKDEMLLRQGGVCKLCKGLNISSRELVVDHVKGSNPVIVRGLLCYKCNMLMGSYTPEFLRLCADYAEKKGQI